MQTGVAVKVGGSVSQVEKNPIFQKKSGFWGGIKRPWPLLLFLALLFVLPQSVLAQEGGTNHAGLIVVHGDGRVLTRCVTFTEERISGVALLQRSGLAVDANSGPMGSAICTINREGCPANDCFCKCKSAPCTYWNYFHRNADGSWVYSGMGAATWTVGDGDIEGWVWGDGSAPPPARAFDAICSAEPAPVAPSSASPTAAPTATPLPPETPIPTPTASLTTPTPIPVSPTIAPATAAILPTSSPIPTVTLSPSPSISPSLSPSPSPSISPSLSPSPSPSPSHPVTPSPTPPLAPSPTPLHPYAPFVLLLSVIGGFALLRRKRG